MNKVVKTVGALGVLGCAILSSPSAMAEDSGWYLGGNIGQSRASIDNVRITSQLLAGGLTTTAMTDDEHDFGFKIFGGYSFSKYLALEGGYFDLGQFNFKRITTPAGTLTGEAKFKGLNLDVVGLLPITDKFSAFGRLGVHYTKTKDRFVGTGAVFVADPSPSNHDANYKFGLGLQYALTENLGIRTEAERFRVDDAIGNRGDVDLFSIGLLYRFGKKTAAVEPLPESPIAEPVAAVPVAPEPKPVEVAPTPEPQPVVVVPPPRPRAAPKKLVLSADSSADSLFDFDKSELKDTGKQALDAFSADLKGADFDEITVTGHTDRIGTHDYNMKLSERRAEAVKAYMVESAGLPAHKITAIGVDGSQPITRSGLCKGKKVTKKLKACLAPDRRVEVEVLATRTVDSTKTVK